MTRYQSYMLVAVLSFIALQGSAIAQSLPADDSSKYQLLVVGQPTVVPARWFSSNENLIAVKKATNWSLLDVNSREHQTLFRERYEPQLGNAFPIVALLRPDGGVIYSADRNSMPNNADKLFQDLKAAVLMAKNAVKANVPLLAPQFTQYGNSYGDSEFAGPFTGQSAFADETVENEFCPDGRCLPTLRRPSKDPFDVVAGGWLSDSVTTVVYAVGGIVGLGFLLVFAILGLGAIYLIGRIMRP